MILELHVADVIDDHKIKMDVMRLKIRKIRNMPFILRLCIIMSLDHCYLSCNYDCICCCI